MKTHTTFWILAVLLVVSAAVGVWAYPHMPERAASHWNARGEVDGYTDRLSALVVTPAIALGMSLLLLGLPLIDPLKENFKSFRGVYNGFIIAFAVFLLYLHGITLLQNLGYSVSMNRLMSPAFALFMIGAGILVGKAKRNFFAGIRTPWTLSSDVVWAKTHRLGQWLFIASGVIALGGLAAPDLAIAFLLVPLLLTALVTVVYSYFAYQEELAAKSK